MYTRKHKNLIPIKIGRVTSNDNWPMIYIPKEAINKLSLQKGARIIILMDLAEKTLIIKPIQA